MKVLVFDDGHQHRLSAQASLKGHDVTVVGTYDEAQQALVPQFDFDKFESIRGDLLRQSGLPGDFNPWRGGATEEQKALYEAASIKARKQATTQSDFDVVMTDLLVPASKQALGGPGIRHAGKEMPLGAIIALLAIRAGARYVAVVTDENHHYHPASAAFDCFEEFEGVTCASVKLICTNRPGGVRMDEATGDAVDDEFLKTDEGKEKYPFLDPDDRYSPRKGIITGKHWGNILNALLSDE